MRLRACIYNLLYKIISKLPQKIQSAHAAFWIGALDCEDINDITVESYNIFSGFGSEEHNLRGLWPWEDAAIDRFFSGGRTFLVAGAGGGREVIALAQRGADIVGFDASRFLTNACRDNLNKANITAQILDAPPGGVPDGLGVYDGLIIGRGVYHHIPGRSRRIGFLKSCGNHLKSDAPVFVGDFLTRPDDLHSFRRVYSVANFVRCIRRSREPIELGDHLNGCFFHRFLREEIEAELDEAGFRMEHYEVTPFGDESNLAHAVARFTGHSLDKTRAFSD